MVLKSPGAANEVTRTVARHCGRKDVRPILTSASYPDSPTWLRSPARRRWLVTLPQPRQSQGHGVRLLRAEALHEYAAIGALLLRLDEDHSSCRAQRTAASPG